MVLEELLTSYSNPNKCIHDISILLYLSNHPSILFCHFQSDCLVRYYYYVLCTLVLWAGSVKVLYEDSLGVVDFHPATSVGVIYVAEADIVGATGYKRKCARLRMVGEIWSLHCIYNNMGGEV